MEEWRPDVKRARKYAKQRSGEVRFAIRDPGGKWHDFHGDRASPMASTITVIERRDSRIGLAIHTEFSPSHGYGKNTLKGVAKRLLRRLRQR